MNSIYIQSIALVSKQKNLKTNIEHDSINLLYTQSNQPEDDSIDHKLQELPEDEEGIGLSGFSSIEISKKEIIKIEQPVYTDEKRCYTQKEIDKALISINQLKQ